MLVDANDDKHGQTGMNREFDQRTSITKKANQKMVGPGF
jgi:hypothetical protein